MLVQFLLLIACLGYSALAIPTTPSQTQQRRSFKVENIQRSNDVHGPTALRQAYRKYGVDSRSTGANLPNFESVVAKRDFKPQGAGAVSVASIEEDRAFVAPVTIGGQQVLMRFDTSSSVTWVMSPEVPVLKVYTHEVFDTSKSATFQKLEGSTFETFPNPLARVSGYVGTDTVDVGGATVSSQAIGIATAIGGSVIHQTESGILGLALPKRPSDIEPDTQKSFFENLVKDLDEPVFTALLKSKGIGEYEFGVVNPNKYRGNLINITVDPSEGLWEFPSSHYKVGNGALTTLHNASTAYVDSTTPLMMLNEEVVKAYYAQVPGAVHRSQYVSEYTYPCHVKLPDLSLGFGDSHVITIPGELLQYNYKKVRTNKTTGEALCYGGVQISRRDELQIWGDIFLKAYYTVFDMRGPSLAIGIPR